MATELEHSRTSLARRLLSGSKPAHPYASVNDDEDEVLHVETDEEEDWEWIYSDDPAELALTNPTSGHGRMRKVSSVLQAALGSRIVGARRGKFECRLGDAVRLKADGKEVWVALICEFNEEHGDSMEATFMWLSPETEIRNKAKRRNDVLPVGESESESTLVEGY